MVYKKHPLPIYQNCIMECGKYVFSMDHVVQETDVIDHLGVSKNSGTPKSSILIGFSIINHPFWGTTIFGNTDLDHFSPKKCQQFSTMKVL